MGCTTSSPSYESANRPGDIPNADKPSRPSKPPILGKAKNKKFSLKLTQRSHSFRMTQEESSSTSPSKPDEGLRPDALDSEDGCNNSTAIAPTRPTMQSKGTAPQKSFNLQPSAGFCFQTERVSTPSGSKPYGDRIYVNVFHSKALKKEQCLLKDATLVGSFTTYSAVITTASFKRTMEDEKYLQVQMLKLINHINKVFPDAELNGHMKVVLSTKTGYLGNNIPSFSMILDMHDPSSEAEVVTAATLGLDDCGGSGSNELRGGRSREGSVDASSAGARSPQMRQLATLIQALGLQAHERELIQHFSSHMETSLSSRSVRPFSSSAFSPPAHTYSGNAASIASSAASPFGASFAKHSPPPPTLIGFIRKRGHVIPKWERRFAVLNQGFLAYYQDDLSHAPYGINLRGMLCLASYREDHSITETHLDQINELAVDEASSSGRQSPRPENTSLLTSNPLYTIHLKRIPTNLDDAAERHLHEQLHKHAGAAARLLADFYLELPTLADKFAWSAALDAHMRYIEAIGQTGLIPDPFKFDASHIHRQSFGHLERLTPLSSTPAGSFPVVPAASSASGTREKDASGAQPSGFSPIMILSKKKDGKEAAQSTSSSATPSPLEILHRIVQDGEEVVFHSHAKKLGRMHVDLDYTLVLVQPYTGGSHTGMNGEQNGARHGCVSAGVGSGHSPYSSHHEHHIASYPRRLLYVQLSTREVHGQFEWLAAGQAENPVVDKTGPTTFQVTDILTRRVVQFQLEDHKLLARWIALLGG